MKKVILSILGLAFLAGCAGYDYYKTNVRYRQVGNDCIYFYNEKGKDFSEEIKNLKDAKKVVYRDVRCEDLYMVDTFGHSDRADRKVIVPVFSREKTMEPKCGLKACGQKQVVKNKYVVVPAYVD